jgi:hypothetical protein
VIVLRARQVLVVAAALIALAGCSSSEETPASSGQGVAPAVDEARAQFVDELDAINGQLVEDKDKAVDNGREICLEIQQGKTAAELEKNTEARFEVTNEWAKKIVAAAKKTICA